MKKIGYLGRNNKKRKKFLKRNIVVLLLVLFLSFTGCVDVQEQDDFSNKSSSNFPSVELSKKELQYFDFYYPKLEGASLNFTENTSSGIKRYIITNKSFIFAIDFAKTYTTDITLYMPQIVEYLGYTPNFKVLDLNVSPPLIYACNEFSRNGPETECIALTRCGAQIITIELWDKYSINQTEPFFVEILSNYSCRSSTFKLLGYNKTITKENKTIDGKYRISEFRSNIPDEVFWKYGLSFAETYGCVNFIIETFDPYINKTKQDIEQCIQTQQGWVNNTKELEKYLTINTERENLNASLLESEYLGLYLEYLLMRIESYNFPSFGREAYEKRLSFVNSTEQVLSKIWEIKTKYPWYRSEYINTLLNESAIIYIFSNQMLNNFYDSLGSDFYKYVAQVSTNSLKVKEIAKLYVGNTSDENGARFNLLNFVRKEVDYEPDFEYNMTFISMNGSTEEKPLDFAFPPQLTLMIKKGDCEDHAILLLALFREVGLGSILCFTDTWFNENYTHMAIATIEDNEYVIWEATCKDCEDNTNYFYNNLICADVDKTLLEIEEKIEELDTIYPPSQS